MPSENELEGARYQGWYVLLWWQKCIKNGIFNYFIMRGICSSSRYLAYCVPIDRDNFFALCSFMPIYCLIILTAIFINIFQ